MNADPNYGSAWFHCRAHPSDIPSHILKNACNILVHEMVDAQKIYCRAILHYVIRCLTAEYEYEETSLCLNRSNSSEQTATSIDANSHSQSPSSSSPTTLAVTVAVAGEKGSKLKQMKDVLMDYSISMSQIGGSSLSEEESSAGSGMIPLVEVDEGNVFAITDFITGVVEMNRALFNRHVSEDMRRRNLFGSDQIIS